MNRFIKAALNQTLPKRFFVALQSIRSRNQQVRLFHEWGCIEAARKFTERHGFVVQHGPFRGMRIPEASVVSRHAMPLLLGSYESELIDIVNSIGPGQYERIINIGCGGGYYAVGLAMKTHSPVYAFDTEPRELRLCKRMAEHNGVGDRVTLGTWCSNSKLRRLTENRRSLVISDCEGGEAQLFGGETDFLSQSDLLIELHDTKQHIVDLFALSHTIVVVQYKGQPPPYLKDYPEVHPRFAREIRSGGTEWAYARSNRSHPAAGHHIGVENIRQ